MNSYFELLKKTLTENNLLDSPDGIYNVGKTGTPLDYRPLKVGIREARKRSELELGPNPSNCMCECYGASNPLFCHI